MPADINLLRKMLGPMLKNGAEEINLEEKTEDDRCGMTKTDDIEHVEEAIPFCYREVSCEVYDESEIEDYTYELSGRQK